MTRIFDLPEALGQPMVRRVPAEATNRKEPRQQRKLLELTYIADDFDAPLPADLLILFGSNP